MKPMKKAALLHDLCGVGKAALTNMIPILSVLGIEACPVPTMLLSTHTGGYGIPAVQKTSPAYIKDCADHYVRESVSFDLIFIGYLGSSELIEAVRYFVHCFPEADVILDPIMGDHGAYYKNFDYTYGQAIRKLLSCADIILPNFTEGCLLTDSPVSDNSESFRLKDICRRLGQYGADTVIMTSVPFEHHEKGIAIYREQTLMMLEEEWLEGEYHGSGDAFDGVFTGMYLKGKTITESVKAAHAFVCACIKTSNAYQYPKREGLMIEKNLHMLV